jgi:nitrate reductase gamma subunit
MVIIHVISGVLWLVAIPFTRLAHILYFFFTRTYMASEFGFRNAKDW